METEIKMKLSTDLNLIKGRLESKLPSVDKLTGQCAEESEVVAKSKKEIEGLPDGLLDGWKRFLLRKKQLLMAFRRNLRSKTAQARSFVSYFFLRPGAIKLYVVNFLLGIMYWVVWVLTRVIIIALVIGVIMLVFYGLDFVIDQVVELIENYRSKDPSGIPKGVE